MHSDISLFWSISINWDYSNSLRRIVFNLNNETFECRFSLLGKILILIARQYSEQIRIWKKMTWDFYSHKEAACLLNEISNKNCTFNLDILDCSPLNCSDILKFTLSKETAHEGLNTLWMPLIHLFIST